MHLTATTRDRHVSDSAGIIPLIIGAVRTPSVHGNGLYLDQPVCRYTPPKVNLMTGQYESRVAETAAVVHHALEDTGIQLVDLIRHVHAEKSYTPMAKIMEEFAACENVLLKAVETSETKLAANAATTSTMVLDDIHRAAKRFAGNAAALEKLKNVVQGLVKNGKELTEDAMGRTLLQSQSHLLNEEFSGLSQFETFWGKHVLTAKHEDFKTAKAAMETHSTSAFLNVVGAFHAYYNLFILATKLDDENKTTDIVTEWRDVAFPVKPDPNSSGTATLDSTVREKTADGVLNKQIWDILLERFEIFASIVEYVFTRIVGPGSDEMELTVKRFVRMGVISCMVTAFQTKANRSLDDIKTLTFTDAAGRLIQEIVLIHSEFKTWIDTFIHADWIADLKLPTETQMLDLAGEETDSVETLDDNTRRLVAQISADLYDPKPLQEGVSGGSFAKLSLKTSKIKNLSIPSTLAALSGEVRRKFEVLAPKEKPAALVVVKKGRKSITSLDVTAERELLRNHIISRMNTIAGTDKSIREIFAAKVLTAVYNHDAYFVAHFLIADTDSTKRGEIAHEVLAKIGSVFKKVSGAAASTADSPPPTSSTSHFKKQVTLDLAFMHDVYAHQDKKRAYATLFPAADADWKKVFSLSPEIKLANERALIKSANTNAQKPAAHRQEPAKPAANPQPPKKTAGKQTGRPQSAPPKATQPQQQQGQNSGKRGRRGRKQQGKGGKK